MTNERNTVTRWRGWLAVACVASMWLAAAPARAAAPAGRYTVATDTVLDTMTGLTWQRAVPTQTYTWEDAGTYCGRLNLGGTGWRLPTSKELRSLVDIRASNPSIDTTAFPGTPNEKFWSSTRDLNHSGWGWVVNFGNGEPLPWARVVDFRVRCVR